MFEFGVRSAFNQTIKRGNPRDLKAMLELLDEHGAMSVVDQRAEAEAGANQAIEKIMNYAFRMEGIDPEDAAQIKQHEQQEASLVMACSHCAPALRELWRESGRRALAKRHRQTRLHDQVADAHAKKGPT